MSAEDTNGHASADASEETAGLDLREAAVTNPPFTQRLVWGVVLIWPIAVVLSLAWNVYQVRQNSLEMGRIEARVAYEKDVLYRRWNAGFGGVYVPVGGATQPNPHLVNTEERDITTPSGRQLTLVNPAYMTRQVHELGLEELGVRGHITSLKPIRAENAPGPWEAEALRAFESGETEVSSVEELDGQEHVRLMRPLVVDEGCLPCHAQQGYKVGEVRGGLSVAIPMQPLRGVERKQVFSLVVGHVFLWLMGLAAIMLGERRMRRSEATG